MELWLRRLTIVVWFQGGPGSGGGFYTAILLCRSQAVVFRKISGARWMPGEIGEMLGLCWVNGSSMEFISTEIVFCELKIVFQPHMIMIFCEGKIVFHWLIKVVFFCRSKVVPCCWGCPWRPCQAHADALYKANHGKLFSHDSRFSSLGSCGWGFEFSKIFQVVVTTKFKKKTWYRWGSLRSLSQMMPRLYKLVTYCLQPLQVDG